MPQSDAPPFYSLLSTHHSTYPTLVLLTNSSIQTLIKDLMSGMRYARVLLSSHCALPVPPLVNDITETFSWLLTEAPFPFATAYAPLVRCLRCVCRHQIHPAEAYFKIALIAMSNILLVFAPILYNDAMEEIRSCLNNQWGERISFVGFRNILLDSYDFLNNNFHSV